MALQGRSCWERYNNGDNLLFQASDFKTPGASPLLREMWGSREAELRTLAGRILLALQGPLDAVPSLDEVLREGVTAPLSAAQQRQVEKVMAEAPARSKAAQEEMDAEALAILLTTPDPPPIELPPADPPGDELDRIIARLKGNADGGQPVSPTPTRGQPPEHAPPEQIPVVELVPATTTRTASAEATPAEQGEPALWASLLDWLKICFGSLLMIFSVFMILGGTCILFIAGDSRAGKYDAVPIAAKLLLFVANSAFYVVLFIVGLRLFRKGNG